MSVIFELAIFPMDKGESVSLYVTRVLDMIDKSGADYRLTPMGTVVEVETMDEALSLVGKAYERLDKDCNRIYAAVKFDARKGRGGRLSQKIDSVQKKTGRKLKT